MPAPVEIDFVAGGVAAVLNAFKTFEERAEQFERRVSGSASSGSATRQSGTKKEVDYRAAELKRLVADAKIHDREMVRDAEKAAAEKVKAAETEAKRKNSIRETSMKMAGRYLEQEVRDEARAAKEKLAIRENSAKMAGRFAMQQANEERRIRERAEADEAAQSRRWTRRYARSAGPAVTNSIGRTVGGLTTLLGSALTVGGGFAAASALRDEMKFEESVAQTSNAAFVEGDPRRTRKAADPAMIAALAKHVQEGTNISKNDAVEALHKYVNIASDLTGMSEVDKKTGRTNLEELARLAKGSGTNFGDLMTSAAYLKAQNPDMSAAEQNSLIRGMVGAGKKGDIALADMAKYSNTATAMAGQYAGDFSTNQGKMLGLMQIAGRVADPAQAAEAVNKLAFDVAKNSDKMPAGSVKDSHGKLLSPEVIISKLMGAAHGDVGKLSDMGIDARSMKVFEGESRVFNEAEMIKKGSGEAAVKRDVLGATNVAYSQQSADTDFANVMNQDTEKLSKVMNDLSETMAHAAMPAFEDFVKTLTEHKGDVEAVINGLGQLAKAFVEHPIKSILELMAANIVKDVAAAEIGTMVKVEIQKAIEKFGAGSAASGAGGGGGKTGALAFSGAVALTLGTAMAVGDAASTGEEHGKLAVKGMLDQLNAAEAGVKAGTMTPAAADEIRRKVKANISQAKDDTGIAGNALDLASVPLSLVSGDARGAIANVHSQDEVVKGQERLVRAMESLERAMKGGGVPAPAAAGASRSGPTGVPK